ncbi:hypothetical protein HOD75_03870 [archaeon]|jgi:hypothetical protein|nr:hypothetical protein [archaeon]MBT4242008.1 hypothetical protein [archaeon]MBT4418555.1 hypothetical protein [archaeon]
MKHKLVFLLGHEGYLKEIREIIKKKGSKICYITLNKSCEYLNGKLNVSNFDEDKFYFIDGVSPIIKKPGDVGNCDFVKMSDGFTKLIGYVKKGLKNGANVVVLDSVSNVLTYHSSTKGTCSFIDRLSKLVEKHNATLVVFCNKNDEERIANGVCISNFKVYKKPFELLGHRE